MSVGQLALKGTTILVAATLGTLGATLTFFGATSVITSIPILLTLATIILITISGGITWLVSHHLTLACGTAVVTLICIGGIAGTTILRPFGFTPNPMEETDNLTMVELPTGSDIALYPFPSVNQAIIQRIPIILLHGGPGIPVPPSVVERIAEPYRQQGYDFYYYAQLGTGRSERLNNPKEYTIARHIADLDAVRAEIGAEQVILIGGSWGAELGGHYMATHPERVSQAILFSPGDLWVDEDDEISPPEATDADTLNLSFGQQMRLLTWTALARINWKTAHNFAPDQEMDGFFDYTLSNGGLTTAVCGPTTIAGVERAGSGWYVPQATGSNYSYTTVTDPRPALSENDTPVLLLRGECETIPFETTLEYRNTLPNSVLLNVPDVGHAMLNEGLAMFHEATLAFLNDEPLPLEPYTDDDNPWE